MVSLSTWSSNARRTLREAFARIACAEGGRMWYRERPFPALASLSDVKYSLTEKWENRTTRDPSMSTMVIKLEHMDNTSSSELSGRQLIWYRGRSPASNSI